MTVLELPTEMEEHARSLHRGSFVFDACLPTTGFFRDEEAELQALVDGEVNGANITVAQQTENFLGTVHLISQHKKLVNRHPDKLRLCASVADLEGCKPQGKIGMVVHFQDSKPIEDDLDYLGVFYDLGLRVLQLTYNVQGYVGTGCCERHDAGLSVFGLEVVAECNRLGILVDLSHCGHGTAWDAIRHSKAPVACTHSGAYAFCPAYGRNKPDDLLKAVAETGGVVGVPLQACFVKRDPETHRVLQASVEDVLDQVDYMVGLLGADHVGIGTDLSNYLARTLELPANSSLRVYRSQRPDVFGVGTPGRYDAYPTGLDTHAKMLNFTRGLVRRGYSDRDVRQILGGNWFRLFKEVWRG